MKLIKTLKIKLGKLSNNKQNILNTVLNKNVKAINFCLQKAKEGKKITHDLVYKDLRKLNLPSCIISGCRRKSIGIIKSYRKYKGKKTFPKLKNSSVIFDHRVIKIRKTDNKLYKYFVSLLYKAVERTEKRDNRIELPLILISNWQNEIINKIGTDYKLGSTELVKKGNDFYIHIFYSKEIELPIPNKSFSPIGVDIGINNLAVTMSPSKVKFHNGERLLWKNEFFRRQRAILQHNFALRELKRLKERQTRYNDFYIQNIAKDIVEQAKQEINPVIVIENLKYILERAKANKKQKIKLHNWVFNKLQKSIEYKANWEGIPIIYVDPYHSSQICSKCGELNKRDKHIYKCKSCGYECNADYNAGRNLQQFFLATCLEEQASINNAFNPSNLELKSEKDIGVENLVK